MATRAVPNVVGQISHPLSGAAPIGPPTVKPKAVARQAVTPALRAQYKAQYGPGWKKANPDAAAAYQTARRAAVKKQMGK